jgi:hypothetical protein
VTFKRGRQGFGFLLMFCPRNSTQKSSLSVIAAKAAIQIF